jgi:hypothetical protein
MRHWLLVTKPWNWRVCETKGLFGFDNRYRTTTERALLAAALSKS